MKNYIWFAIVVLTLSSCKKWLDVNPVSQVSEEELFKSAEGFEEALSGVYTSCTNMNLYGFELTGGLPEALAQNYTIPGDDFLHYQQAVNYNYKDRFYIARKDTVWSGLYNAIANCNLLLKNIESKGSVLTTERRLLIKGEALALRGFLHFDLLRLFGSSYISNPGAQAIPYVTEFSNKITSMKTVSEVFTNIVNDLTQAKELVRAVDPIVTDAYKVGYNTDRPSTEESSPVLFLQNRRHRLNYYAICGELARVNLYFGKNADALSNAMEVIRSNKFPWTASSDFTHSDVKQKDRIMYKELLFAWYVPNMRDTLSTRFNIGLKSLITEKNGLNAVYDVGGAGGDDRRYKEWFKAVSGASSFDWFELQKYVRDPNTNRHYLVLPAIRLSEMYYIAAECTYETDAAKGIELLQTVRAARGINKPLVVATKEQMLQELVKEARKEFFGEGQLFYMYKRLNRPIANLLGGNVPASDRVFVMPLPDNEIEFGNR